MFEIIRRQFCRFICKDGFKHTVVVSSCMYKIRQFTVLVEMQKIDFFSIAKREGTQTTMSQTSKKIYFNRDLMSEIFQYFDRHDFRVLRKDPYFRNLIHYDQISPQYNTLVYGQVQSGKTHKIMEYIRTYHTKLKILVIQNSRSMILQYCNTLRTEGISHVVMTRNALYTPYKGERVLIAMHNRYRKSYLTQYLRNMTNVPTYSLILDESDVYIRKISETSLYLRAKHVLHVTATPFAYVNCREKLDYIVNIPQKKYYLGLENIRIIPKVLPPTPTPNMFSLIHNITDTVKLIVKEDFVPEQKGLLLVTCFSAIHRMRTLGSDIAQENPDIPIIVLTSKSKLYFQGNVSSLQKHNVKLVIEMLSKLAPKSILIANRIASRGVNFTDRKYSTHITHQILTFGNNTTSILQKCRIFGNRSSSEECQGKLYCIMKKEEHVQRIEKMKIRVSNIIRKLKLTHGIETTDSTLPTKQCITTLTVPELKRLCKEHNLTRYSSLTKPRLIELLTEHNISI